MKQAASPHRGRGRPTVGWPGEGTRTVIPAQAGIQAALGLLLWAWGPSGTVGSVLDSRLRGNDTLGLVRQETGRLLPSAKLLPNREANNPFVQPSSILRTTYPQMPPPKRITQRKAVCLGRGSPTGLSLRGCSENPLFAGCYHQPAASRLPKPPIKREYFGKAEGFGNGSGRRPAPNFGTASPPDL